MYGGQYQIQLSRSGVWYRAGTMNAAVARVVAVALSSDEA